MPPSRICPKCGYDLGGVIDAWSHECPVRGTCSECGHPFEWVDIFAPDRLRLRGFVEHAPTRLTTWWWACRTWLWTVLPWRFWGRVTLDQPIAVARMLIWLPLLLLSGHVVASLLACAEVTIEAATTPWRTHEVGNDVGCWSPPALRVSFWRGSWFAQFRPPQAIPLLIAFHLAWPAMMLALIPSRRLARLRKAHVARASIYGLAWLVVPITVRPFYELFVRSSLGDVQVAIVLWVWIGTWWWFAIRSWRLERGTLVFGLLLVVATLCALLAHAATLPLYAHLSWPYL